MAAGMLRVTHHRFVPDAGYDRNGKPIPGWDDTFERATAFAPGVKGEINSVEQQLSTTGGTLYLRGRNRVVVNESDEFTIRGIRYKVDGPDAYWVHPDGEARGTVVILERTEVTRG